MPNNKGLSHYLSGDDSLEEMIATLPQFGFALMTAGKTPPNAAELLGSDRFSLLVETLLARSDHEIGRASCRESVCKYVYISVVTVHLKIQTSNYIISSRNMRKECFAQH